MQLDELKGRYAHLRSELNKAYASAEWDSNRINGITDEIVSLEYALASLQSGTIHEESSRV